MQPISFFSRPSRALLTAIGLAGAASQASAVGLVQNGGFETGDFGSWTQTGDRSFAGVQCSTPVAEGKCDAFFGTSGLVTGIQQSLATAIGSRYTISFVFKGDNNPGSFSADFGSSNLVSISTLASKTYSFDSVATTANTLLKFQFRDDLGFVELDAVQVIAAVPEPSSVAMMGLGLAGVVAFRRSRKRRVTAA